MLLDLRYVNQVRYNSLKKLTLCCNSALENVDLFFEVRYVSLELFPLHGELHVLLNYPNSEHTFRFMGNRFEPISGKMEGRIVL